MLFAMRIAQKLGFDYKEPAMKAQQFLGCGFFIAMFALASAGCPI